MTPPFGRGSETQMGRYSAMALAGLGELGSSGQAEAYPTWGML